MPAMLIGAATLLLVIATRGSLPQLDGHARIPTLSAPASIGRDAEGHVTIVASNRLDAARALGYAHAQDRFFQMDLLRRLGAGRLAELAGSALLDQDKANRIFRGATLAEEALKRLPKPELDLLVAYTEGVNAGLDSLIVRPPEYLLLRQSPEPWHPSDCLILNLTFGFNLQDPTGAPDLRREQLRRTLHPAAYAFFVPRGTDRDATLEGHGYPEPRLPTAAEFSAPPPPAPKPPAQSASTANPDSEPLQPGSNAWALGGRSTRSGAALIADDMHLDITAPGVWYRAVIRWTDPDGQPRLLAGVTLPGAPTLITGSNGNVAWGFTNSQIDTSDLVELELDPANPNRYRTPDGWREFDIIEEPIRVAHSHPVPFRVTNTIWGPVIPASTNLPVYATCWVMARPEALAPLSFPLENATNVAQAIEAAHRTPRPVQNFVVGDRNGTIAWTLIGLIPDRGNGTGEFPERWSQAGNSWKGTLAPDDFPTVMNPSVDRIWTANQRVSGDPRYLKLGDGGWDSGARASRIRDDLLALSNAAPADMLAIQLDDTIPLMHPWRDRLIPVVERLQSEAVSRKVDKAVWDGVISELKEWDGRAAANSRAFLTIARFRRQVFNLLHEPLWWTVRKLEPDFIGTDNQADRTVEILLRDRPAHFLNPRFASYEGLFDEAARRALSVTNGNPAPLQAWGSMNQTSIRHRLSPALPAWMARRLDMEPEPQSGFAYGLPRIASAAFGASERFGIEPGNETNSYLHTPAGQSGHFLSPFYRSGHAAWMQGRPTPLLGMGLQHELTLTGGR